MRSSYIARLSKSLPPGSKLPVLSTAAELSLGAIAGALAQIFTIPVSVIATRQQIGRAVADAAKVKADKSYADAASESKEEAAAFMIADYRSKGWI